MFELDNLDYIAIGWFFLCWMGYAYFSRHYAKRQHRLQSALQCYIDEWMRVLLKRDGRIADTAVVSNLERTATFLASSSLLIIAGLLTLVGATDSATDFILELPFTDYLSSRGWQGKILFLVFMYVYAFFTFTWCIRQYGFLSILIGSAPLYDDDSYSTQERDDHAETGAKLASLAVYSFNMGLRSYYFSLALLLWFIHPFAFMVGSAWVVAVLYRREFRSRTLKTLTEGFKLKKTCD